MANSGVRLTMKFNFPMGLKSSGWSESLDLAYTTIPQAESNIISINRLLTYRLACLGSGVRCVSAVLTADPGGIIVPPRGRRATLEIDVPNALDPNTDEEVYNKALGIYPADYSTTVLYFSCQTDSTVVPVYRRNLWIAGIPDACDESKALLPLAGPWITAFEKFRTFIGSTTTQLGTRPGIVSIRSIDQSDANPLKRCTGYNTDLRVFTVPGHGFLANQLIVAEGFRAKPGETCPKGQYKVLRIDDNTIGLAGARVTTATVPPGAFRAVKYTWNALVNATMKGFSKRNKGKPFFLAVGRQRRRITTRA